MYGILTILYVLKHFENEEEYEECQKIMDAINEQNVRLECNIPTVISEALHYEIIEVYKRFGLTGVNVEHNSAYYCSLVIQEIDDTLTEKA